MLFSFSVEVIKLCFSLLRSILDISLYLVRSRQFLLIWQLRALSKDFIKVTLYVSIFLNSDWLL